MRNQLLIWAAAAAAALTGLGLVLWWESKAGNTRGATLWVGDPRVGAKLFFQKKHCGQCHSVNGYGGKQAPDLGYTKMPEKSLSQLVCALWNCAPRMWDQMRTAKMYYPALNQKEMSHLFAFLYTSRYLDEPGDRTRGEELLHSKGCTRCHGTGQAAANGAPELSAVIGVDTPILWMQTMWNHAPQMEAQMQKVGIPWPKFEGPDMNDLLAYVREVSRWPRRESQVLPANPIRGWRLFQKKSCIQCHSVNGEGGRIGPELGPNRKLPLSVVQFAALMWSHSPEMWRIQANEKLPRPRFDGQEMADLVAFLSNLRYFEPAGSAPMGETRFSERQCHRCHGEKGEGSRYGPALRGRGHSYTTVSLATALWSHGPKMYQRTLELNIPWPTLTESDVGNLISFLNAPMGEEQ